MRLAGAVERRAAVAQVVVGAERVGEAEDLVDKGLVAAPRAGRAVRRGNGGTGHVLGTRFFALHIVRSDDIGRWEGAGTPLVSATVPKISKNLKKSENPLF